MDMEVKRNIMTSCYRPNLTFVVRLSCVMMHSNLRGNSRWEPVKESSHSNSTCWQIHGLYNWYCSKNVVYCGCYKLWTLRSSQRGKSQACTKWKIDNLSNIVFLEVFIFTLNVCTNFITESYRTIKLPHIHDRNKRQEGLNLQIRPGNSWPVHTLLNCVKYKMHRPSVTQCLILIYIYIYIYTPFNPFPSMGARTVYLV